MKKLLISLAIGSVLAATSMASAQDQAQAERLAERALPASVLGLQLDAPLQISGVDAASLQRSSVFADGSNQVIIRLSADSGADAFAKGRDTAKAKKTAETQQKAFLNSVHSLDRNARVIAQVQTVMNAVFVEVDAAILPELARDARVVRIAPVGNYELDLSETVPYIGGAAVQADGFDGSGIKVAVLDSGIDYYHAGLFGAGDPADFANDDPTMIEPGTFPTAKVVGGYDFVGSVWPNGALAPDPDPLDDGPEGGHGTHVAHIIAGDGGVAPGADLYGVKVCSSVSTSCSGIALIQGMDFAADPNGDGKYDDRVDIINMSLGSSYGQPFDDDLAFAVDSATRLGILTVASAGNSSDKPYATGTPSAAETALSVAQTAVPSGFLPLMQILEPPSIAGNFPAVFQPWSAPLVAAIEAPLQYGDGAGGNLDGCAPFAPGSLAGKIVLVNRGACNFTLKVKTVGDAGGLIGIIGLIAPGDPFEGGDGGDAPITVPGYMVSQAIANRLRSGLPNTVVRFDPNVGLPLAGTMVGGSSRGPQHESTTLIKPEIGAPGASVSAIAGTGTGEGPFGGTSGAAPMVSGAAALVLQAYGGSKASPQGTPAGLAIGHGLTPLQVKALLMNNGETEIVNDPMTGALAPITRIGGGEVRVDRALEAPAAAWDRDVPSGALGFGFIDVADEVVTLRKWVEISNLENTRRSYTITPTFRFADDEANGAVTVSAPSQVVVRPGIGRSSYFDVTLTIDGALLRGNAMNSGNQGANPATLTLNEYDGYLVLDDGQHPIHLAWHVLPRKAARVTPDTASLVPGSFPQVIGLDNSGVGTAQNDAYALLAVSPDLPEGASGQQEPTPDIRAVGINTFPVPAGFCSANPSFLWVFAVNTWERQQHLLPVRHFVYLDTNQDGITDYLVFNQDQSVFTTGSFGTISDGRQLTLSYDLNAGTIDAFFYAEHSTNTGNTVLLVCGEQVGLTGTDMLATNVDMAVEAEDFYFGGPGDFVEGLTVTPLGERFYGVPNDVPGNTYDPAGLAVYDFGLWPGNSPEVGLLLFTNGDRGASNRGGATEDTEALLFESP